MKREGETKEREVGGKKEGDERKEAMGGLPTLYLTRGYASTHGYIHGMS